MRSSVLRLCSALLAFAGAGALRAEIAVERSVGAARITQVAVLPVADLVVLDAGYDAGLRQGMVCTATRAGENLGELLLVDLRSGASTALILGLAPGRSLQRGDSVAVKTISSRK